MALVVEDGTGLAAANAYISVAFADTYHGDRGNTKWTDESVSVPKKEQAIVRATDFINKLFGRKFIGTRRLELQGLEWPRIDAWDLDHYLLSAQVPPQLQKACAEYALRAVLLNVLAPDPGSAVPSQDNTFGSSSGTAAAIGEIKSQKVVVGPLEIDTSYNTLSSMQADLPDNRSKSGLVTDALIPQYPEADMWLEELLRASGTSTVGKV